jgi:FkbM family methyltransferase
LSVFCDEASVLINIASLVDHNTVFIDVGAYIGLYAAVISHLRNHKSGLSILAFEVNPETFSRLEQNARRYGFEAACIGLADGEDHKLFVEGAVSHVTTTFEKKTNYNIATKTFTQRCVPLSAIEVPEGSIVLKIDVEGQEYEILLGARKYFENDVVKAVYIDGFDDPQVISFLVGFGFDLYDGQTFERTDGRVFSLLAIKRKLPSNRDRL